MRRIVGGCPGTCRSMCHLAGRTASREASAGGTELVVMRHEDAAWWETPLLMLGSEADDRRLIDRVATQLLGADEEGLQSSTRFFLLSMLREEVDVDPGVRDRILDVALPFTSPVFVSLIRTAEDVTYFSRRHGAAVREKLVRRNRIVRDRPPHG